MIPTGSKLWFGVAGFALAATVAYFIASNGEEYGSMVLLSLVVAAFTLGLLSSFIGDGDVRATSGATGEGAAAGGQGGAVPTPALQLAAAWPALGAVGAGVAIVGLATGGLFLYIGLLLVAAAGAEWMIQAWAERATPDLERNRALRNRLMYPIEIPVLAATVIAVVIIASSRVFLAVPKAGSTVVAVVVATVILAAAFLITSRPKLSSSLITGVVALGAAGLLGGGIVAAVAGEREFEVHSEEGAGSEGGGGEPGGGEAAGALISASNTDGFDEDLISVPSGVPVTITFENRQGGVQHNVHITDPVDVQGPLVTGPDSATFEVTFEDPGEYPFMCDVHPNMEGTIEAVEQPAEAEAKSESPEGGGGEGVDELDGDGY